MGLGVREAKDGAAGGSVSLSVWGEHQEGEWEELSIPGEAAPPGHPQHCCFLLAAWKRAWGLQSPLALGQAPSRAWGDTGPGRSPICRGCAEGFTAETPGELNVGVLLASSAVGGRALRAPPDPLGGLVGWGHRDPSLGGMGPCRADNPPGCPSQAEGAADKSAVGRAGLSSRPGLG